MILTPVTTVKGREVSDEILKFLPKCCSNTAQIYRQWPFNYTRSVARDFNQYCFNARAKSVCKVPNRFTLTPISATRMHAYLFIYDA